jgi:hypothetical protein
MLKQAWQGDSGKKKPFAIDRQSKKQTRHGYSGSIHFEHAFNIPFAIQHLNATGNDILILPLVMADAVGRCYIYPAIAIRTGRFPNPVGANEVAAVCTDLHYDSLLA